MSNNPLKQYFRRPAIYVRLPSNGRGYEPGVVELPENGEIPVYPMTAIDEISSRTPDAVFNGQALADIIKSCVPCIKDPWRINNIDLDTLMIAIKVASNGDTMDVMSICPECNNEGKYGVNLVNLLGAVSSFSYDEPLRIRDLEIKFQPMTYSQSNKNNMAQYEIQKAFVAVQQIEDAEEKVKQSKLLVEQLNNVVNSAFSETIEYIRTPETTVTSKEFIKEFLDNCDKRTNTEIFNYALKLKDDNKIKPFRMVCQNCQHQYDQELVINITDFFD